MHNVLKGGGTGYLFKARSVNQYILICLSPNKACFTTSLILIHTIDRSAIAYFSNSNHQSRDFTALLASQTPLLTGYLHNTIPYM